MGPAQYPCPNEAQMQPKPIFGISTDAAFVQLRVVLLCLSADAGGEATGELNRERDGAREPSLLAPAICSYPRTPLYWPPRKVYLCMVCRQGSGKVDFAFA